MQETLVIYLHHEMPSWVVVDADNAVRESAVDDSAEGLAAIADEKKVIVIVPAQDVLLASVELPPMPRSKLLKAIPFALEDQLITDVEGLHFAAGDMQAQNIYPVAVIAHHKMREWLDLLNSWNIVPDILLPASLALPFDMFAWHVAVVGNAIVRTGQFKGFAAEQTQLQAWLDAAVTEHHAIPKDLYLHYYTDEKNLAEIELTNLPFTIKHEIKSQASWIIDAAKQVKTVPAFNLLQGNYAPKKSAFPSLNKLWKITAYLGAVWLILLFLYPTFSYFILRHRLNAINADIAAIYKKHFPQAAEVIAPKIRMQEKIQHLSSAVSKNKIFVLLGLVGKGLQSNSSVKLKRMDFQNNQLTLELSAASSEDFAAFTDFLNRQGLNVKQQNATLAGTRVNAIVDVE